MGHIVCRLDLPRKTHFMEKRGKRVSHTPLDRSGMNPPVAMALADCFILFALFPFKFAVFEQGSKKCHYACLIGEIPRNAASKGSPVKASYEDMNGIFIMKVLHRKRFPMAPI